MTNLTCPICRRPLVNLIESMMEALWHADNGPIDPRKVK